MIWHAGLRQEDRPLRLSRLLNFMLVRFRLDLLDGILMIPLKFVFTGTFAAISCLFFTVSCDRKEKLLDVDTPDGGIKVERDKDTGEVDIKVE